MKWNEIHNPATKQNLQTEIFSLSACRFYFYELIWDRADFDKVYFPDKILIIGHTPVISISGENSPKILKQNNPIAIDCGSGFGGKLAVLCLDTMEEFYF